MLNVLEGKRSSLLCQSPSPPPPPRLGSRGSKPGSGCGSASSYVNTSGGEDYTQAGLTFWKEHFGPGRLVPWPRFVGALEQYVRKAYPKQLHERVTVDDILRIFIVRREANRAENVLAVEEWAVFLHRFGPLECSLGKAARSFFTADGGLVPWFHGSITRRAAKELVAKEAGGKPGNFLVRFSETNLRNLSVTYLEDTGPLRPHSQHREGQHAELRGPMNGVPRSASLPSDSAPRTLSYKNVLIHNRGQLGFALSASSPEGECFPGVRDLVASHQAWRHPCPSLLAAQFQDELVQRRTRPGSGSEGGAWEGGTPSKEEDGREARGGGWGTGSVRDGREARGGGWGTGSVRAIDRSKESLPRSLAVPVPVRSEGAGRNGLEGRADGEGGGESGEEGREEGRWRGAGQGRGRRSRLRKGEDRNEEAVQDPLASTVCSPAEDFVVKGEGFGGGGESVKNGEGGRYYGWKDGEGDEYKDDLDSQTTRGSLPQEQAQRRHFSKGPGAEDSLVEDEDGGEEEGGNEEGEEEEEEEDEDEDEDEEEEEGDEEDEEDEEEEDEEEEEEEEAERETHEPSEIEMRQRLRLLHTMSSVSSMGEAATLLNRAMLNTACGRFEDALCLLDDVLGMASAETTSVEEARMQARAAKVKGTVLQEMGLMKEASVWYELSVRAGRRLLQQAPLSEDLRKYFPSLRYVHNQLAQFYLSVRAFALVLEHFEQLVALTDDAGHRRLLLREFERLSLEHDFWQDVTPGMLDQELEQGRRWYREKCWEEAALQFRRVVQLARLASFSSGDGTRMVEARALGNYATVLKDLRRCDESILAYRLCCRLLEELEEEQMERRMLNGLSLSLIEAHRYEDAAVVCERLLVLTERDDNVELVKTRLEEIQACLRDGRRTMERESVDEGNEETR